MLSSAVPPVRWDQVTTSEVNNGGAEALLGASQRGPGNGEDWRPAGSECDGAWAGVCEGEEPAVRVWL